LHTTEYDFPLYINCECYASQPCGRFLTAKKNLNSLENVFGIMISLAFVTLCRLGMLVLFKTGGGGGEPLLHHERMHPA